MLQEWDRRFPGRVDTIFNSLQRVDASHLFDRRLFDFAAVAATGVPAGDGDKAFDTEEDSLDSEGHGVVKIDSM